MAKKIEKQGQKERLVKLLNHQFGKQVSEIVADWLIANDVAIPVKCKNCARRKKTADLTDTVWCPWFSTDMSKDGFCSYGIPEEG